MNKPVCTHLPPTVLSTLIYQALITLLELGGRGSFVPHAVKQSSSAEGRAVLRVRLDKDVVWPLVLMVAVLPH